MPTLTPLAHLTAARGLLAPGPECWTQRTAGRTADGVADNSADLRDAVCVCMLGAVWRLSGNCGSSQAEVILTRIVRTTTRFDNPASFNDHPATTHADVLRVYDLAIAAAGE